MDSGLLSVRCSRCLYDSSVPNIAFDERGVCNYCHQNDALAKEYPNGAEGLGKLETLIRQIKVSGRSRKYDAVIGVSGGCDSSYLLHELTTKYQLRLLAVHFDNTWNSTIATENISRMLEALQIDLYTVLVDNREYDDIYRSFLRAGVKDLEAPTDIALASSMYLAAQKYNVKYMIDGHSFRTEGVAPLGWTYMDGRYIRSVHRKYGTVPMKTYPNLTFLRQLRWMLFSRIKKVRPLYYMDYDKEAAKSLLASLYGWQWYGGHHLENRFTAFYFSYFMPRRWNIDFRIAGFSAYCRQGWIGRKEALALLRQEPYMESGLLDYVKQRLGFSSSEFESLMSLPRKSYKDYPTYKRLFELLRPFFWLMYKMELIPKSFYIKYTVPDAT